MAETTRTSIRDFVVDVKEQVQKVTWPDQAQLKNFTGVTLAFLALTALVILAMDQTASLVLSTISSLFG